MRLWLRFSGDQTCVSNTDGHVQMPMHEDVEFEGIYVHIIHTYKTLYEKCILAVSVQINRVKCKKKKKKNNMAQSDSSVSRQQQQWWGWWWWRPLHSPVTVPARTSHSV